MAIRIGPVGWGLVVSDAGYLDHAQGPDAPQQVRDYTRFTRYLYGSFGGSALLRAFEQISADERGVLLIWYINGGDQVLENSIRVGEGDVAGQVRSEAVEAAALVALEAIGITPVVYGPPLPAELQQVGGSSGSSLPDAGTTPTDLQVNVEALNPSGATGTTMSPFTGAAPLPSPLLETQAVEASLGGMSTDYPTGTVVRTDQGTIHVLAPNDPTFDPENPVDINGDPVVGRVTHYNVNPVLDKLDPPSVQPPTVTGQGVFAGAQPAIQQDGNAGALAALLAVGGLLLVAGLLAAALGGR